MMIDSLDKHTSQYNSSSQGENDLYIFKIDIRNYILDSISKLIFDLVSKLIFEIIY